MNAKNIVLLLRQIFVSAAIALAISYVAAVRFGSWWWTLAAIPLGILLCDVRQSAKVIAETFNKCVQYFNCPEGFEDLKEATKDAWQEKIWPIAKNTLRLAFFNLWWILAVAVGFVLTWQTVPQETFGEFSSLLFDMFMMDLIIIGGLTLVWHELNEEVNEPLNMPVVRFIMEYIGNKLDESENPYDFEDKHEGVLLCGVKDRHGKKLDLQRFCFLLILSTILLVWPFLVFLLAVIAALQMAIFVADILVTVLLNLAVAKSVSAGAGAFIGAVIEYLWFPNFSPTVLDITRFILFMIIGGALGCGICLQRELLILADEADKKKMVKFV